MARVNLPILKITTVMLAMVVVLPLLVVFSGWMQSENLVWEHLLRTVLGDLLKNTAWLLLGVGIGVTILGVGLAWLTTRCEFPCRRIFDWALMLPLAVPAYVMAFVALGLLDYTGPVQTGLRETLGSNNFWFPEVRSTGGVITVMTLVLYPYVYMLARSSFITQGNSTVEAARSLGLSAWGAFFRVSIPTARPAIVAGVSLALMEALADFGAVAIFNYDTFTTAIYKAWFGLFNLQAASQLASFLLILAVIALTAERQLRGKAKYHEATRSTNVYRYHLAGWHRWGALFIVSLISLLAFIVPIIQLSIWAWGVLSEDMDGRYIGLLLHTLMLGGMAAGLTVISAMVLAFTRRTHSDFLVRGSVNIATLGYALPGSVLAVGVMLTFTSIDNVLTTMATLIGWQSPGQILTGSVFALVMAYMVRFLAVAYGPIESGLCRIRVGIAEAARGLGDSPLFTLWRVYLPLLRPGLFTAGLLVLVDVMKEMPATMLLRPFGWDTLAVRIYEMTSEGEWERAALPAITLILVGLIPVIVLVRRSAIYQGRN
ncbi:MAG: iron ABC transporter permease [Gammaproteobacteria bacterium]|nr:iron ABC transporter permease [Gammaproteobacteria bacterium]